MSNFRSAISLTLIVAALLGSAFIWYRFFTSTPPPPVVSVSASVPAVGSQSLLNLLGALEGLKLDLGVLDNPLYKSLQDFTPDIAFPESRGRNNPFVPL